jgi:hypothetical protein
MPLLGYTLGKGSTCILSIDLIMPVVPEIDDDDRTDFSVNT